MSRIESTAGAVTLVASLAVYRFHRRVGQAGVALSGACLAKGLLESETRRPPLRVDLSEQPGANLAEVPEDTDELVLPPDASDLAPLRNRQITVLDASRANVDVRTIPATVREVYLSKQSVNLDELGHVESLHASECEFAGGPHHFVQEIAFSHCPLPSITLFPNVTKVDLRGMPITNEDLRSLPLTVIWLATDSQQVTSLAPLVRHHLRVLLVRGTRIGDQDLRICADSLKELDVHNTNVASLDWLSRFRRLTLRFGRTELWTLTPSQLGEDAT